MSRLQLVGRYRARSRPQGGAAAVEFALILPLLAMLMLGILTFGVTYSNDVALTNAVREGARFGATTEDAGSGAWGDAVQQRTFDIYGGSFDSLTLSNVCALLVEYSDLDGDASTPLEPTYRDSSDAACEAEGGADTPDAGVVPDSPASVTAADAESSCLVKVWARVPARLSWVLGSMEVDVRAESVSGYVREGCP